MWRGFSRPPRDPASTRRRRRAKPATFAEFIEGRHGVLLTAAQQDVAGFLARLREHGIDSRSSARKLSCLRGFYKWLPLDRRIHHDPTVNIESPKAWKVLPKSLAEPEVTEMLERAA